MWSDDTDDPWKTWFYMLDDERCAVTADFSAAAAAPNVRLPFLTCITVPVRGNGDWYLTPEEEADVDRLVDGMDALIKGPRRGLSRLLPRLPDETQFVGQRDQEGKCQLFWYSSRLVRKSDVNALAAHVPGLQWSATTHKDPGWRFYFDNLHPGAALSPLLTSWAQLRQRKREYGEDLFIPREVSHTLMFKDEEGRSQFIAQFTSAFAGWLASTYEASEAPDGRRFAVILSGTHRIIQMVSDPHIIALSQRAELWGGVYDGWGSLVVGAEEKKESEPQG